MSVDTLLVIAVVIGFYKAWNIGANDVANGMGTVVGAGTLTLRRAILLASVFEFAGAFLVGGGVTKAIKDDIISSAIFNESAANLHIFGLGMLAVALSSAIWLNIATLLSRPVSVTQATIGGIIGFALVSPIGGGAQCVNWGKLGEIAATWITSPLVGGLGAFLVYKLIVRMVLRNRHPVFMAKRFVPLGFALTLSIIFFSATYKGLPRITIPIALPWHLCLTAGLAVVSFFAVSWIISIRTVRDRIRLSERYEVVEVWFGRLQVMTACYMSFAHGANDVASAIGPLAGSMQAFTGQKLGSDTPISAWLMAFGGAGIVIGLVTMGYRVIMAVGKKITEITPTRGFSAEFATASTVLVCSKLHIPISTTFVMVGAIMGVGFARGFGALDLKVIRQIFMSWIVTIPISAILSAGIFAGLQQIVR